MKPFEFRLQTVRTLREHRETTARRQYANSLRACEEAAAKMQAAAEALTGCWNTLSSQLAAGVNGTELLRARAWCNVLELRVRERAANLQQARLELDGVWQGLLAATREREGMDRLFAKQRRAHQRALQSEQQKHLDELAIQLSQVAVPGKPAAQARISHRL